jgi:hypothetical protein
MRTSRGLVCARRARLALRVAAALLLASFTTACFPYYAELTGGVHSVSGKSLDSQFAPSAGVGFGFPFYFGGSGGSVGVGVDWLRSDSPRGALDVWSGGLVLRGTLGTTSGRLMYSGDVVFATPGTTSIDGADPGGSAHGLFVGGTVGYYWGAAVTASLGPHFVFGSANKVGSLFSWGGQLRLRYINLAAP